MSEPQKRVTNLYASEAEDTDPGSRAGRFFLVRWYRGLTYGLGKGRGVFLPLGMLSLTGLAFHLGYPALREGMDLLLRMGHAFLGAFGEVAEALLGLQARRAAIEVGSLLWAITASAWLAVLGFPDEEAQEELGYVVPGSGLLARCWAVIGKRIYQLKVSLKGLAAYLRDLNLAKLHLPLTVPLVVFLGFFGLADAFSTALFELSLWLPGRAGQAAWHGPASQLLAGAVVLVLGLPMLWNTLKRIHRRSVEARKRGQGLAWRFLRGLPGLVFLLPPVAWMCMSLLAGRLG